MPKYQLRFPPYKSFHLKTRTTNAIPKQADITPNKNPTIKPATTFWFTSNSSKLNFPIKVFSL